MVHNFFQGNKLFFNLFFSGVAFYVAFKIWVLDLAELHQTELALAQLFQFPVFLLAGWVSIHCSLHFRKFDCK
jgi:hypothetical protein